MERHVLNVSQELVSRGHEVHVFTNSEGRHAGPLPGREAMGAVTVHRYKPLVRLGEFGSFWPGFLADVLDGGFDIVHAHSFRHPHTDLSALTGRLSRSRSVLTSHSPFHPPGVRKSLARGLVPVYDRLLAPVTLRAFDGLIALTTGEGEALVSLGAPKERVNVIPNGVESVHFRKADYTEFKNRHHLDGPVVLYLGRMNRTKGLATLLRAFAYVTKECADVTLVLAGPATSSEESEYLASLKLMAERTGISRKVVFTGRLSEEDRNAALEMCSVFVLPSLYEPFGIVLLEAAAHGKALVSARSEGPASIISHGVNGVLVKPEEPAELAVALTHILSDDSYRARVGAAARETALRYTWGHVVDRVEHVYRGGPD